MRRAARRLAVALGIVLALLAAGVVVTALRHLPLFEHRAPERLDHGPAAAHRPAPRRVALVSVDGLAPRVLSAAPTPTLARLAREGLRAERARTVVPSITMTSHVSMLSGVPPEVHGVTFNRYQPWSGIPVPTILSRCAGAGLRCGLFAGKRKFAHLAEGEPGVERYRYAPDAASVLEEAARYSAERGPDLLVVHLAEVDLAGHRAGWDGPVQRAALTGVDALLGRFVERLCAGADRPLAVLVTSDHGGHGTSHGTSAPEDVRIPWILWGDGIAPGTLPEVSTLDTAPTVAALLGLPTQEEWVGTARLPPTARAATAPTRCADPGLALR